LGLVGVFVGVAAGGVSAVRLGLFPSLIVGAVLQALGTASFALLALIPGDVGVFSAVMAGDNFAQGYAGVVLIAYMSSLTSLGYTATQYALLSSVYALLGKFLKGFSGAVVESLAPEHGLLGAYAVAFVCAGLIAVIPLALFAILARLTARRAAA
jgi:PAT family beta-lactamase induction signal transducer AmpG